MVACHFLVFALAIHATIAPPAGKPQHFSLEDELCFLIAEGQASICRTTRLARAIASTCLNVPQAVHKLGALGQSGASDSHVERDLLAWARKQAWRALMPEPFEFFLPFKNKRRRQPPVLRKHAVLLPHEVFSSVYAQSRELFEHLFTGQNGNLDQFWESTRNNHPDFFYSHPTLRRFANHLQRVVPYGLHGDDAGVFNNEKVLVLSWGSVAVQQYTLDSRIVFAAMDFRHAIKGRTDRILYKILSWSLNVLATGLHPHKDPHGVAFSPTHHPKRFALAGKPLAPLDGNPSNIGFCGAFSEIRGDWKWVAETFMLNAYYNALCVCHLCRAHKRIKRLLYTNFRRTDRLRRTRYTHRQWSRWQHSVPVARKCWLIFLEGFFIWRIWVDAMHCLDLGVLQVVVASIMWELSSVSWGSWIGNSRQERLDIAYDEYTDFCKRMRVERLCKPLRASMFKRKGFSYPTCNQLAMKAAGIRSFMYWLSELCSQPDLIMDTYGQVRSNLCLGFITFDTICREHGRFIPPDACEELADAMELFLTSFNFLADFNLRAGVSLYKMLPKAHMATHIAYDQAQYANPRRVHCYPDEDMIGKVKKILERCHGSTAAVRVLGRYCILVCVRWWNQLAYLRDLPA